MRDAIERWIVGRWYGRPGLLWLLLPIEGLYRLLMRWRGMPPRDAAGAPVIVVGNLTVGGSGKTPLVLWLVEALRARRLRVGVIARGYGGSGPFPLQVTAQSDPAACGDEPLMIARRTGVPCVVAPDRAQALRTLRDHGVDVVVSDDGLQHRGLPRAVEIVVVDGDRGFGNGHCLPVGPLREPASRLSSVDFVVMNGAAADGALEMSVTPLAFRSVADDTRALSPADFRAQFGEQVSAVAGVGNPARFLGTLRALGFTVTPHLFGDHHRYVDGDLPAGERVVVMTGKDAVKCASLPSAQQAWYLDVVARLPDGFIDLVLSRAGLAEKKT